MKELNNETQPFNKAYMMLWCARVCARNNYNNLFNLYIKQALNWAQKVEQHGAWVVLHERIAFLAAEYDEREFSVAVENRLTGCQYNAAMAEREARTGSYEQVVQKVLSLPDNYSCSQVKEASLLAVVYVLIEFNKLDKAEEVLSIVSSKFLSDAAWDIYSLSSTYVKMKNFEKAESLASSINIYKNSNAARHAALSYCEMASSKLYSNELNEAKIYLKKAFEISSTIPRSKQSEASTMDAITIDCRIAKLYFTGRYACVLRPTSFPPAKPHEVFLRH